MKYYLLMIHAANGILHDTIANTEIVYSYQGTAEPKKGDCIAGYVGQPAGQVRMLFEVTRDSDNNKLYLKKIIDVYPGAEAGNFEELSDVTDMAEASFKDVIEIEAGLYDEIKSRLIKGIADEMEDEEEGLKEQFEQYIYNVRKLSSTRQVSELGKWSDKLVESGILDKGIFQILDADEYRIAAQKIKESEIYKLQKGEKTKESWFRTAFRSGDDEL